MNAVLKHMKVKELTSLTDHLTAQLRHPHSHSQAHVIALAVAAIQASEKLDRAVTGLAASRILGIVEHGCAPAHPVPTPVP